MFKDFYIPATRNGFVLALGFCLLLVQLIPAVGSADELVLDESVIGSKTVGDFDISTFISSVELEQAGLLDESGTISIGALCKMFKDKGVTSVYDINLCLDVQDTDLRADYALDSIELRIEDLDVEKARERFFTLGDNSLTLPGYEKSGAKPEAKISINLGYDLMEKFDENSTERLKFDYVAADGKRNSLPVTVGVLMPSAGQSWSRFLFLAVFAAFWIVVFLVLFRVAAPRSQNAASPA